MWKYLIPLTLFFQRGLHGIKNAKQDIEERMCSHTGKHEGDTLQKLLLFLQTLVILVYKNKSLGKLQRPNSIFLS